jgi:hypothetical protein
MTDPKWYEKIDKNSTPKRTRIPKGTLVKAIKENCLECSGGSRSELRYCTIEHCKLWPFRLGITPANLKEASEPTRDLPPPSSKDA